MIEIALALVALLVLLLLTPISFNVSMKLPDAKRFSLYLWGGLLGVDSSESRLRVSLAGLGIQFKKKDRLPAAKPSESQASQKKKKTGKKKEKAPRDYVKIIRAVLNSQYVRTWFIAIKRSLHSLLSTFRLRRIAADLVVGMGDPAQTGKLIGFWYALHSSCAEVFPLFKNLKISPDFYDKNVSGDVEISGSTSLFRIFRPVLVLIWHAPLYRTIKIFRLI